MFVGMFYDSNTKKIMKYVIKERKQSDHKNCSVL